MIYNTNKIFAKVWRVIKYENKKYFTVQISTYEKTKDGEYTYSSWFARVIGHAFNKLKDIKEGDRIVITQSKFTNEKYQAPDSEEKKSVFKFIILEAELDSNNNSEGGSTATPAQPEEQQPESQPQSEEQPQADDNCPW